MDGRGIKNLHKCGEEMSKNSSRAKNSKKQVSWMARAGGEGRIRGAKAFCPGWKHQPGQKGGLLSRLVVPTGTKGYAGLLSRLDPPTGTKCPHFVLVGVSNWDKRPWPPYPLPSPPARAIQLTCFLCSWLGIEEFLLISSPHLWRSLIPRPSICSKGLGLVFLFFLGLYSSFHTLEIEKMCS